jgi:hypothetical protein
MNIKTPLCRAFEQDLHKRLHNYAQAFSSFVSEFDKKRHFIKARYVIFTPEEVLFTKAGHISSLSVDTDAHKVMRDVLYECIGIDDKVERNTTFFTPVSPDGKWNYLIELELFNKEVLYV